MNNFREQLRVTKIYSENREYKESIEQRIAKAVWRAIADVPCTSEEQNKKAEIMSKINRVITGIEEKER